jgi:hypothetical protein
MSEQYQFQSDGETVTVEIEENENGEKDLIFVDYNLTRDRAVLEFGYPPTHALILATLWEDPNRAQAFSVCYSNDDFYIFDQWCMLGNPEARTILSYSLDSAERGSAAALGVGFSPEQRLRMATYGDDPVSISVFLAHYNGTDLPRGTRAELQAALPPADKCWLAWNSRNHNSNERFELVLEATDDCKLNVLKRTSLIVIKGKKELALLNSITNDETLARALCLVRFVRNYDYIDQVKRIQDRQWVDYVLQNAPFEVGQMLRLMGF